VPTGATGFSLVLDGASANNLTLTGAGAMSLTGNSGDNVLTGNTGNNVLTGLAGNDTLSGGAGNDTLSGGAGTNVLDGGPGVDTAVFAGNASDYSIVYNASNITVTSIGGFSPASTNTLTNIETLDFEGQIGNILIVGPNSQYTTIQAAVNAATAGDTIQVLPGTYSEQVNITKSLTLLSTAGAASTVITSPTGGYVGAITVATGV
jgi:Ca2+-binding RTX toxin-like protein